MGHGASHSESAVLGPLPEAASLSLSHFDGPILTRSLALCRGRRASAPAVPARLLVGGPDHILCEHFTSFSISHPHSQAQSSWNTVTNLNCHDV